MQKGINLISDQMITGLQLVVVYSRICSGSQFEVVAVVNTRDL